MKVLIPVDGSEASLNTIRAASRLLDKRSARIYLFHVIVPTPAELPWAALGQESEEAAREILHVAEREARNAGLDVAEKDYRIFHEPASAICDYADERQADQILIGSHGYQGLAKLLMGSVSERVFRQAKQPVIIVRNDKDHTVEISHFERTGLKETR